MGNSNANRQATVRRRGGGDPAPSELGNEVLVSLRRIIRAIDLHSKRVARACGLTTPQLIVLRAIDELGEVTTGRISDHVSLSQATVTTILDRLVEHGHVERYRSEGDRRVVHSRLTARGRDSLAGAPSLLHDRFLGALGDLPREEQTGILDALNRVACMMDAHAIDAGPLLAVETLGPAPGHRGEHDHTRHAGRTSP